MSRPRGRGSVGGLVVRRSVRQQHRATSLDRLANEPRLWARIGQGGLHAGPLRGPRVKKRKEPDWGNSA
jgi:hypothetical protein